MLWKVPALAGLAVLVLCSGVVALGGWDADSFAAEQLATTAERQRFHEIDQAILERVRLRAEVVGQVLHERLTLLEAAAWFRCYGEGAADRPLEKLDCYPGPNVEEKLCWQVISWAETQARNEGWPDSRIEAVQTRLRSELATARTAGRGTIRLPDR